MAWEVWAQGTGLQDLAAVISDRPLPKGSRARVVLDLTLPVAYAFDLAGAELVFRPFIPDGMDLVDVWGEGARRGIVEMESDPAWLLAILLFLKAHWLAITIGGLLLTTIIGSITLLVWLAGKAAGPAGLGFGLMLGLGAVAGGAALLLSGKKKVPEG